MCRCKGCGVHLQNENANDIGYTVDIQNDLCERCFRIKNYNEYKAVTKSNDDYIKIIENISKTNDLVVLVVDLFNISKNLNYLGKLLNNDILLVLSKRDILPKSCYDKKIIDYFKDYKLNIIDTEIISSKKNINFDSLYEKINKYKKSNNVYVVGFTNAGKSTMINKIIYNYSDYKSEITTSNIPSTTLDSINIKVNNSLTLIDTPGILDEGDMTNYIDSKDLKKIQPNKEIKPITYQIKGKQTLLFNDLVRIDLENTNITIYISNTININRVYKHNDNLLDLEEHFISVKQNQDLVIQGFGFINFSQSADVVIHTKWGVSVYTRKELI